MPVLSLRMVRSLPCRYRIEKKVRENISLWKNKLSKGIELQHKEYVREMQAIWCSYYVKSKAGYLYSGQIVENLVYYIRELALAL